MKRELFLLGAVLLAANIFAQAPQTIFLNTETDPSVVTDYSAVVETKSNTVEPSASVATHYVGEYYGGGIVFYVDEEGKHGLITTTIDKSIRKQQKSDARIITNAVRDGITTGKFNEDRINAIKGAGVNDALTDGNHQDANLSEWYLPTRYDLIKLYHNRAVIGGYSAFARGWRSAEFSSVNEWYRSFVTGGEFRNGKDDEVYIRVIRKF